VKRQLLVAITLMLNPLITAACGEDRLTFEGLAGEYSMTGVDGSAPPVVIDSADARTAEITGGQLTMLPVGEYTMRIDFRIALAGVADPIVTDSTFFHVGGYTIVEDLLIMSTTTRGVNLSATVSGPRIRVALPEEDGPGVLLTYVRSGDLQ
jgi:hypothetical protein